MSSHRDFTPDEDQDELLLEATRPPESPRDERSRRRSSVPGTSAPPANLQQPQSTPAVTSIRLKIGGSSNNGSKHPSSKPPSSSSSSNRVKQEEGDTAAGLLNAAVPSSTAASVSFDVSDKVRHPDSAKPAIISDGNRPGASAAAGSRKRVLSNPTEPSIDGTASTSQLEGTTSRKRAKVVSGLGKKNKRGSKSVAHQSEQGAEVPRLPSPGMYPEDGDDLLADELSLMDEEVAKRSTRGSSPQFRDTVPSEGRHAHSPSAEMAPARLATPSVPPPNDPDVTVKSRQTPESSPEITLLDEVPQPVVVPIPHPAPPAPVPHVRKKKKAWLHNTLPAAQKTMVPIAIAPNPGSFSGATGLMQAHAGTSNDPHAFTPPPSFVTIDKRKGTRKVRTMKQQHLVPSPHLESLEGDVAYSLPPPDMDEQSMFYERDDSMALDGRDDSMALDGTSDGGGDGKPKKKKSRKLKPGEIGPGKHWRKGVFGPHSSRQIGPDGNEIGGESPRSTPGGSSHGGRLILPKPSDGRGPSGMGRNMYTNAGDSETPYDQGTPEYEDFDNASNRSSPEIMMRNDPTIIFPRPPLQTRGSQMAPPPAPKAKPLLEGAHGQYIVPKLPAQVDDLGHPIYRNSILTRGISIIRIQDFSGPKAKERELTVPRALKDNLGARARQFDEGYRIITGVGGAKLKFRSWIPRTVVSEYRMERDARIEEIRAREAALAAGMNTEGLSRPALWATGSHRKLSTDGMTPESWPGYQTQIHLGQQVRKISAFAQTLDAGATPPKKPAAKKKKKKKVYKSAPELVPDMPSPILDSVAASAAASPDVLLNDPMDAIPPPRNPSRQERFIEQSPTHVDDLIMDTV